MQKKHDILEPFMAMTGPFAKYVVTTSWLYKYQQWYRQAAPYKAPLPYIMMHRTSKPLYAWTEGDASSPYFSLGESSPCTAEALSKAYAKLKGKINEEQALLSVNIAERKQGLDMMASRLSKTLKFAKALKSFRLGEACEALGLTVVARKKNAVVVKRPRIVNDRLWRFAKRREARRDAHQKSVRDGVRSDLREPDFFIMPNGSRRVLRRTPDTVELRVKRHAKSYADNYLEFHFGWEPLVKDIWASANIALEKPFKGLSKRYVAGGTATYQEVPSVPSALGRIRNFVNWRESVVIRCNAVVTNPSLRQYEQLGLLNPAVLAYELVPFSFVVNWFVNVEQMLSLPSDFAGLDLQYASTTRFVTASDTYKIRSAYIAKGAEVAYRQTEHLRVERKLGVSTPKLYVKPFTGFSLTRGLTAVSLLVQFLRST
jgi:hypothetical protein